MSYSEILYPLGANNTSLTVDNTNLRGIGWVAGGGGGGINAVNPGNNIDVATVNNVATVSLENPLTAPLNIGTQDITGTTSNIILTNNGATIEMGGNGITPTNYSYAGINRQDNGNLVIQNTAPNNGDIQLNTTNGIVSSNSALQVPAIRDAGGLTGGANQVLSAGPAGGSLVWVAPGGGGAITAVNPGYNIDVNTVGTVATVSLKAPLTTNLDMGAVDITTSTVNGQIEMVLNGDGRFVVSQNSAGGDNFPAMTIQNQNGNANEVHIDIYKNSASPAVNDGIGAISFHANNSVGGKQQFAYIQANCIDPTAGSPNASISMYSCVNNAVPSEYLRLSGSTDRVESYKNIDMIGTTPVIMGSTCGNLSLNTSSSSGAGAITVQSKGILQLTAPTSLLANCNAFQFVASQQSTIISPIQILAGSVSTTSLDMIYRATLQPSLTSSPVALNTGAFSADGQHLTLINNSGNGSNDLQAVSTPNFQIYTQVFIQQAYAGAGGFLVSGYNHLPPGYPEIRIAPTMADILSNNPASYTYIALAGQTFYVNCCYFDPATPNIAVFGGFFQIGAGQFTGNGPRNVFPSAVSNILVINTGVSGGGGGIYPYDMVGANTFYGFNNGGNNPSNRGVMCFSNWAMGGTMDGPQFGIPNARYVVVGGAFTDTVPPTGGGNAPILLARIRIDKELDNTFDIDQPYGLISYNGIPEYISFVGITSEPAVQTVDTQLIVGGRMEMGGANWSGNYLASTSYTFWDAGQGDWASNFLPSPYNTTASFITAGAPANPLFSPNTQWILSIWNTTTSAIDTILFECQITTFNASFLVIEASHPSGVFSYAMDKAQNYPTSLKYAIGGSQAYNNTPGSTPFCFEFFSSGYVNLNGAPNFGNCTLQPVSGDWWFFRDPQSGNQDYSVEVANVVIPIEINTIASLPFVNYLTPAVSNNTITLGTTNNFALGIYVGHGTNDARILITTHNGATFTN